MQMQKTKQMYVVVTYVRMYTSSMVPYRTQKIIIHSTIPYWYVLYQYMGHKIQKVQTGTVPTYHYILFLHKKYYSTLIYVHYIEKSYLDLVSGNN